MADPREVALFYHPVLGWVVEVPRPLAPQHLEVLRARAVKIQEQMKYRYTGEQRKDAEEKIALLQKPGSLRQRVRGAEMNDRGDIDLFPPVPTRQSTVSIPGFSPAGTLVKG